MPRLISLSPESEGQSIDLVEDLTVGREPSNSLVLENKSISAFHCVIEKTPDGAVKRSLFPVRFVPMTGKARTR